MTCPINGRPCNKYKAFHVTEKINGKVENYVVCEDCLYSSKNINLVKEESYCACGTKITDILKGGKVGCAKCYDSFGQDMRQILATIHNTTEPTHTGTTPYLWKIQQAERTTCTEFIEELKLKINVAIQKEDYKKASWIKEQIEKFQEIELKYIEADEKQAPTLKSELVNFIYEFREKELL